MILKLLVAEAAIRVKRVNLVAVVLQTLLPFHQTLFQMDMEEISVQWVIDGQIFLFTMFMQKAFK